MRRAGFEYTAVNEEDAGRWMLVGAVGGCR